MYKKYILLFVMLVCSGVSIMSAEPAKKGASPVLSLLSPGRSPGRPEIVASPAPLLSPLRSLTISTASPSSLALPFGSPRYSTNVALNALNPLSPPPINPMASTLMRPTAVHPAVAPPAPLLSPAAPSRKSSATLPSLARMATIPEEEDQPAAETPRSRAIRTAPGQWLGRLVWITSPRKHSLEAMSPRGMKESIPVVTPSSLDDECRDIIKELEQYNTYFGTEESTSLVKALREARESGIGREGILVEVGKFLSSNNALGLPRYYDLIYARKLSGQYGPVY